MLHLHSNHGLTLRRLWMSALFFFLSFLIQGLGGFLTGSIGLISDSLENLNDVFVNTLSMGSLWVAHKQSPDHRWPYGLHRLEVVNGLIVVILLGLFGFFVGSEVLDRLQNPQPIQAGKVLLFALSGLILNLVATRILVPNEEDLAKNNLNLKGAYIHALQPFAFCQGDHRLSGGLQGCLVEADQAGVAQEGLDAEGAGKAGGA
jgi:cobalt-zinc-cadmium efflux system protein